MIRSTPAALLFGWLMTCGIALAADAGIPRAEHPRPDAQRRHWASLNGRWEFQFDSQDEGVAAGWHKPGAPGYDRTILVPFPWESELSGIHQAKGAPRSAGIGDTSQFPRIFRLMSGSGSDSTQSTGVPKCGSMVSRSPTTKEDIPQSKWMFPTS